jgi:hypothetical protein
MAEELTGAWKEIFCDSAFLRKATEKHCRCVLICNNERWLNRCGPLKENEKIYVILYVLDPSGDMLHDEDGKSYDEDGKSYEYSALLRRCLHHGNHEEKTGEVTFSDPRRANIKLNIWQHDIHTRAARGTWNVDGQLVPVFKIEKGDSGTVVDDIKKVLLIEHGGSRTYALFFKHEKKHKKAVEYVLKHAKVPTELRLQLPKSKTSKFEEIVIVEGPPFHLRRCTPVCCTSFRTYETDFIMFKKIKWCIEDHPVNADMTLPGSLDFVFSQQTMIRVSDHSRKRFEDIPVHGTVGNILITLYNFFQLMKADWVRRHGMDKNDNDVPDYQDGNKGWYVGHGDTMQGIKYVPYEGWEFLAG